MMGSFFVAALKQEHLAHMTIADPDRRKNVEFRLKSHNRIRKTMVGKRQTKIAFFPSQASRKAPCKSLLVDVLRQRLLSPAEAAAAYPREAEMCDLLRYPGLSTAAQIWCIELGERAEVEDIVLLRPLNLWITPQFSGGVPRFCKLQDLGKTITYGGEAVALRQEQFSAHALR